MPLALAQDAIALLMDLAERGEVDPWDVKVIDVIDRFLRELNPTIGTGRELYESNLSQSGQAFLYASMLLLLKAENLTQAEASEAEAETDEFTDCEEDSGAALPPHLERRLTRRAVAQPPRKRRVTLKELIAQLQTIAAALEEPPTRRRPPIRPQSRKQAIRAIAQLAHQENLSEMALTLEQFFTEHWASSGSAQEWLDFELLLEMWSHKSSLSNETEEAISSQHDRVGVFWALLLLSAQSKVELSQEEFYSDLKIRLLEPSVAQIFPSTTVPPL
ncbi:MAG TPA: ScpA family protein [Thermosynechococcaceae cyanobacterium]